ncbi:hypothetical protein DPEC_G00164050 [Dallia pectoralis]|uniref:Uncharacterized protein n=1 Tax=Dallia pectoralis TaxID=75939 RepID=A0ACC2GH32_DALPE|nr:hypothetical protein DPEC_G00164050 [Dallia pectoralis]
MCTYIPIRSNCIISQKHHASGTVNNVGLDSDFGDGLTLSLPYSVLIRVSIKPGTAVAWPRPRWARGHDWTPRTPTINHRRNREIEPQIEGRGVTMAIQLVERGAVEF